MNDVAFSKALAFTLKEEGGYVNDPDDAGGPTNHGVTQHTYDTFRTNQGLGTRDVKLILGPEVSQIYAQMYWQPAHCDDMSLGLAISHFDWAVNHGPTGAIEQLQRVLMIEDDGIYGPVTRKAMAAQDHDQLWHEYNQLRREWYREDVARLPKQSKFLSDWLGRCDRLDAYVENQ